MVAFAEPSRPTRRAPARPCEGSAPSAPGKNPVLHTDRNQQYSVTALTNGGGAIVERYAYTAYGQPTFLDGSGTTLTSSAEDNRYTYTGREWDEKLHLYDYRARMYDAVGGRFLGRDPIGYEGSEWGLYEYVNTAPLNKQDPFGLRGDCHENFNVCIRAAEDRAMKCREFESDWICAAKMGSDHARCRAARAICIMKKIRPRFKLPCLPVIFVPPGYDYEGPYA